MNRIFMIVISLTLYSSATLAQNIQTQTLEWQSSSTFAVTPGTLTEETTKVVSGPNQVIWYNKDGIAQKTFTITGSSGSWTNVSTSGSMTFNVTFDDHSGAISFSKDGSVVLIRFYLVDGEEPSIFELKITNVNSI